MPPLPRELRELKVAKAWRLTPRLWREQSVDDRAQMMRYEIFMQTCLSYRDEWKEKTRRAKEKERGGRGENPYASALNAFGLPNPFRDKS